MTLLLQIQETLSRVSPQSRKAVAAAIAVGPAGLILLRIIATRSRSKDGLKELRYSAAKLPVLGHAHLFLRPGQGGASQRIQLATMRHGPLCRWNILGWEMVATADANLVQELSERDDVFQKTKPVAKPFTMLRDLGGDGLFTAGTEESAWKVAHRILTPVFALTSLKEYVPVMDTMCRRLLKRIEDTCQREGSFDAPKLMTDMTFDTIGLCGMGTDLGSLRSDAPPAFIQAMNDALRLIMEKTFGSELLFVLLNSKGQRRLQESIQYMFAFVDALVAQRRGKNPPVSPDGKPLPFSPQTNSAPADSHKPFQALAGLSPPASPMPPTPQSPATPGSVSGRSRKDVLDLMLSEKDGKSGQRLTDENIRYQLVTFLVAGHETTSALLSFALVMIAQHPEVERRLLAEIDAVFGAPSSRPVGAEVEVTFERIKELPYMMQVLKETLRLFPPAPGFQKVALQDTSLGGYRIRKGTAIDVLLFGLHRNPKYWEEPVDRFDPDRFTPDKEAKRHPHAWKPWGDGVRACIGRQFAYLEAKAVLAALLSRYRVVTADPDHKVTIQEQLTYKPYNLRMKLVPRH